MLPRLLLSGLAIQGLLITSVLGAAGSQNPFGDQDETPPPPSNAGSQNPFGDTLADVATPPDNTGAPAGGSGSQSPFGSGTNGAAGGNASVKSPAEPSIEQAGCPSNRAGPPGEAMVQTSSAVCPSEDGKTYQTDSGVFFNIQCCTHGSSTVLETFIAKDFKDCMNACAETETCNSVIFVKREYSGTEPVNQCKLSAPGGYSEAKCGDDMHSYASFIDPPPIESPNSATIMCSTECPYANGQQHVTAVGEAFRMDCGMRHGTAPIYMNRQNTLKECIEGCGKLSACRSVDYDKNRKICYHSDHIGPPTIPASGFDSAYSTGYAGACSSERCGKCSEPAPVAFKEQDTSPFSQYGTLPDPSPPESLCPGLSGTIRTVNGKKFQMTCGFANGCDASLDLRSATERPTNSLDECLNDCANNSECKSMNFLGTDLANGKRGICNIRKCTISPATAGIPGNHINAMLL
ncbi:hypothetical protein EAE96_004314 [Botrytis aclada]|nr:hypothetical protein EAE96_004314 [Botrytis aclada]